VRLVIVDSLTFPFRDLDVGAPGQAAQRSELLYSLSSRLKALAQTWRVAVVVTNHVVDCVDHGSSSLLALEQATGGLPLLSSGRRVMPALGLHWANCVSTRLFMSRDTRAGALASEAEVTRRMRVVFSPHLPAAECRFAVRATGVSGVEPEPGEEPIA
jgi:DNA-repair protein XRCC3